MSDAQPTPTDARHQPVTEAPRPSSPPRLPQIDGVRGLALLGMLAWHAQITWVKGGFARMTVFFVLAGFLAFSAFQRGTDAGEPHPLRTYWVRRVRRLMPVTLVGVALALVVTAVIGSDHAQNSAGWDTVATLTSWINWRFIASRQRYADLFSSPTAFEHFWSLSLEEQCFLLTPLLALAVLRLDVRRAGYVLVAAAAAIAAMPLFWKQSPDAVYYGTHVRIGEFIAGAALAVFVPLAASGRSAPMTRLIRVWAPLSLATLVAVMLTVPRDLPWLYRGGLGLMIVPAAGILAGAVTAERITTRVLSVGPLVLLGRAALSIYAVHWPIYLFIAHVAPRLQGAALQVTQLTASIAFGLALFRWFEQPLMRASNGNDSAATDVGGTVRHAARTIRDIAWATPRRSVTTLAVVSAIVATAAWTLKTGSDSLDFDKALSAQEQLIDQSTDRSSAADSGANHRTRFAIFGGSAAVNLWFAGDGWLKDHDDEVTVVGGDAQLGCGLLTDGVRYSIAAPVEASDANGGLAGFAMKPTEPPCLLQPLLWPKRIRDFRTTTALYVSSTWDIGTWIFDPASGESHIPGDHEFDRQLLESMERRFDAMYDAGLERLYVTNLNAAPPSMDATLAAQWEARSDSYEAVLRKVASSRNWIRIIDQRAYTRTLGEERFSTLFPDGIHVSIELGRQVWDELLGSFVLDS